MKDSPKKFPPRISRPELCSFPGSSQHFVPLEIFGGIELQFQEWRHPVFGRGGEERIHCLAPVLLGESHLCNADELQLFQRLGAILVNRNQIKSDRMSDPVPGVTCLL